MDEYKIANLVQFNNKAEAQAIQDYTEFLDAVDNSDLDEDMKEHIHEVIDEIIGDEMNHQERLAELYTLLTNIEANKD